MLVSTQAFSKDWPGAIRVSSRIVSSERLAARHWLPALTKGVALVFFVGVGLGRVAVAVAVGFASAMAVN